MKKLISILALVVISGSVYATIGDTWDARTDWVNGLDQSTNPNVPWTYRHGDGTLLLWNAAGQWDRPAGYTKTLPPAPAQEGLLFVASGAPDFEGHGPWIVRWTSPVTGQIQIDAYVYGTVDYGRLTQWKLLNNGGVVSEGFIPYDTVTHQSLLGPDHKAVIGAVLNVVAGDTVDLFAGPMGWGQVPPPEEGAPSPAPQWVGGGFTITQVPEPATLALLGIGGLFAASRRRK